MAKVAAAGVFAICLLAVAAIAYFAFRICFQRFFPAKIPAELTFEHTFEGTGTLRQIAEELASCFGLRPDLVVCLGPVRGSAGRVLFHSGPQNKRGNIHRADYIVHLSRLGRKSVRMELRINHPYSYLRAKNAELAALKTALAEAVARGWIDERSESKKAG